MTCQHKLQTFHVSSPIGNLTIIVCLNGLHFLSQDNDITDENFEPDLNIKVKLLSVTPQNDEVKDHLIKCIQWLETYFNDVQSCGAKDLPSICVASETGTFHEKVWLTLAKCVGPGQTISYGDLAKLARNPGASRAAGTAMATNPLQLLVPCHRVIRSDGSMGQYSRGCRNTVKSWLLKHEGVVLKKV